MIQTLDHIQLAMPAGREADARAYYGGVLELVEIEKPPELRARGGVWFSLADGRQIHLGIETDFRPAKKAHPCFVTDQFEILVQRLRGAGYDVEVDALHPPVRRFYTHDAFGNRLEFADRMSGSAGES
jgi:catechol 2,3-dioxygenase-like lactoylglutathione lyase family enzyme